MSEAMKFLIFGGVLGFIGSIAASAVWEWLKAKGREAKQHKFIEELNDSLDHYADFEPLTEEEVSNRRKDVKSKVMGLSKKIFGKESPQLKSLRLESTKYPPIDCKWCYRAHTAKDGSRGGCRTCNLPLDIWIGCQSKYRDDTVEEKFCPN